MGKKTNLKNWGIITEIVVLILSVNVQAASWNIDGGSLNIGNGNEIYVDASAPPGGDGLFWATAHKYLADGLARANHGDTIFVAEGTYRPDEDTAEPTGTGLRTDTFSLINGVAIYGGFPTGGGDLTDRDPNRYPSILSGDLNEDDGVDFANNDENSYNVVTGSGTEPNAILDGFTIMAGNADGSPPHHSGGGMYNYSGRPTVTNCMFRGNQANYGGAMCNDDNSSSTVTNCTFSGNSAGDYGGGICNNGSFPIVTNCILWGNSAGISGPEMFNDSSTPTISNSDIEASGGSGAWDSSFGTDGGGNIDDDPLFKDADGPDDIVGTEDDNLRLSLGSLCIDAGDNAAVSEVNDLDGNPRIVNGTVDMGAYEYAVSQPCGNLTPAQLDVWSNTWSEPDSWCALCWRCGDVNGDGFVTFGDVVDTFSYFKDSTSNGEGDVNMDGFETFGDVIDCFNKFKSGQGCTPAYCQ
ncbi:choice-of-anchor Q domain-containing protein [Planctomycetota bacterium]